MEKLQPSELTFQHRILPFWNDSELPGFVARTTTNYVTVPITTLVDRNVDTKILEKILGKLPEGAFICGGFALSLFSGKSGDAKDIDVMFTSEIAFKDTFNLLIKPPAKPKEGPDEYSRWRDYTLETDFEDFIKDSKKHRFVKFVHPSRPTIQLIKLVWYQDGNHVIDTFDFTVTQIAINKDLIYMNPLTPIDIANKRLVLHRMQFPASTLRRLIKYASKGYYACPGSLVHISKEIMAHKGNTDLLNDEMFVYID